MNTGDGYFQKMCEDAMNELVKAGDWRKVTPNVLIMACFGMAFNHLAGKILRPVRWFVLIIFAGLVWWIISTIIFQTPAPPPGV